MIHFNVPSHRLGKGLKVRTRLYKVSPQQQTSADCNVQLMEKAACEGAVRKECTFDQEDAVRICGLKKEVIQKDLKQRLRDFKNILSQVGPCRGYFPRWYYDASMQMCLQFIYGGCRGNSNNFDDYEDCMRLCETNSRAQEGESLEAAALTAAAGEEGHQNDQGDLVMVHSTIVYNVL